MSKLHPRLLRRNHTYYIRITIPRCLNNIVKSREIRYSLRTNDYFEALERLRRESYRADCLIRCIMRIEKSCLLFDDNDIDAALMQRLDDIDYFCQDNYSSIRKGSKTFKDISLFSLEKLDSLDRYEIEQNDAVFDHKMCQTSAFVRSYLTKLKDKPTTSSSTKQLIDKVLLGNVHIGSLAKNMNLRKENKLWYIELLHRLDDIEIDTESRIQTIAEGKIYQTPDPRIRCLSDALTIKKQNELACYTPKSKTKWNDIVQKLNVYRKNRKNTADTTLKDNFTYADTLKSLLKREYVEDITYQDCRDVSEYIYNVPKNWKQNFPNSELYDIVRDTSLTYEKLSKKTMKKYIVFLKSLLLFARKEKLDVISDFSDALDIPPIQDGDEINIESYTQDELVKIFGSDSYPSRYDRKYFAKFWIPLIGLYTGARLNEICQLYVDDIRKENGIFYFNITRDRPDQFTKNTQSIRKVPIHSKLIELGFLDFVKAVKKSKKDRIFYNLTFQKKNHYAGSTSTAYGRYLDKIGITDRSKVFHSFRHNIETILAHKKVPQSMINAMCGWKNKSIPELNYLDKYPLSVLQKEMESLQYPYLDKCFEKLMPDPKRGIF